MKKSSSASSFEFQAWVFFAFVYATIMLVQFIPAVPDELLCRCSQVDAECWSDLEMR